MLLINQFECDNRKAQVYRSGFDTFMAHLHVKGAGLVDELELDSQDEANEVALEFVRGAKFKLKD